MPVGPLSATESPCQEVPHLREQGDTTHDPRHHRQDNHANGSGIPLARGREEELPLRIGRRCRRWRTRAAPGDRPARIWRRAAPTGSATSWWWGPVGPARRPWSRRCSPLRELSRARAPCAKAPRCATSRSPSRPTVARSPWRSRPLVHDGIKVNLVDTPGYADFVGELRAGLRAADCALFVVAANEGVDDATRDAVARVRRRRHAARGGRHQARPGARRLRRRARPGAGRLRRQGDAALPAGPRGRARSCR